MTVSTQAFADEGDVISALWRLRNDKQFKDELGEKVREVVDAFADERLNQAIRDATREFIKNYDIGRIVDQRFDQKLAEEVDKQLAEERNQPAIKGIVTKAVDAKLNELKNNARVRTQKRRRK